MKTYYLCDRHGDKKLFKETKICGVIASKWILIIYRIFLLSQKNKLSTLCSISYFCYEPQKKQKKQKKNWKRFGI